MTGARTKAQWIRLGVIALVLWGVAIGTKIYLTHVLLLAHARRVAERHKHSTPVTSPTTTPRP